MPAGQKVTHPWASGSSCHTLGCDRKNCEWQTAASACDTPWVVWWPAGTRPEWLQFVITCDILCLDLDDLPVEMSLELEDSPVSTFRTRARQLFQYRHYRFKM
ncbi:hypothetical protein GH714_035737 [Hevea brasiliensis]|uniref:Uncharacterized protein n=1 Tax=Hevea brasiliensis TaxID=3981 RepID=A0A6A6L7D9_HEVBR|nr:hypothetical protein GH714_035737 [Hevea brasiliensis]